MMLPLHGALESNEAMARDQLRDIRCQYDVSYVNEGERNNMANHEHTVANRPAVDQRVPAVKCCNGPPSSLQPAC